MKIGQGYVFFTPQWWWIIVLCLVIAFSLGWLFPVEGPFDYVYDDYASQPAHNRPSKCCASPVEKQTKIEFNINDLSEEDFEELMQIFSNYGK